MTSSFKITVLMFFCLSPGFHCYREEERTFFELTKKLLKDFYYSDNFCFVWKLIAGVTGAMAAMYMAVGALGFGAAGVVAGSRAAAYQASLGGTVAAGSLFAILQSVGAAGLGAAVKAALAISLAVVAFYYSTTCDDGQAAGADGTCSR